MSKVDDLSDPAVITLIGELIKCIDVNNEFSIFSERIIVNGNEYKILVSNDYRGLIIKLVEK